MSHQPTAPFCRAHRQNYFPDFIHFRKDGVEEWVLIHIEAQGETKSEDRPIFSERMFRYFYRCLDKYRRPIAAIALFTGPDARRMPGSYEYAFLNTKLLYKYNTICILDYSDKIDAITDKKNTMDIFEIVAEWKLEEAREEGLKKAWNKA
jgi:hypothetical protein